jgi:hypothetical protein
MFSFFIHLSSGFCRYSPPLVLRFYDSAYRYRLGSILYGCSRSNSHDTGMTDLCSPSSAAVFEARQVTELPIVVRVVEITAEDTARGEIILDELEHTLIQLMRMPAAEPALPGS